jgi:hypothetical protein
MADIAVKGVLEANTTLSGTMTTADGVVVNDGDYMLAAAQASGTQNGIWIAHAGAWTRPTEGLDYRKGYEVRVLEGSSNELAMWIQSNDGIPDTSSTTFRKASQGRIYEGAGIIQINDYQISVIPSGVIAGTYELPTLNLDTYGRVTSASGGDITASFIEGLGFEYVSATQVKLKAGNAYIPGLNRIIPVIADITTNVISGANSLTYLYLYETNGVGQLETSSTGPDVPYIGTARYKTGDPTRRYLGCIKNDASGNLIPFNCEVLAGNIFKLAYGLGDDNTTLRVVNAFTGATTVQTVNVGPSAGTAANRLSGPGAASVLAYWVTTGSGAKWLGYTPSTVPPNKLLVASSGKHWVDLSSTNDLQYKLDTGADTISVYITGYIGRR